MNLTKYKITLFLDGEVKIFLKFNFQFTIFENKKFKFIKQF